MSILKLIRNLLGGKSQQSSVASVISDPNTYYFHEDSYRQIEFLPKENFQLVKRTTEEIANQARISIDDNGWTNCYERSDSDFPTKSKDILVIEISAFFKQNGFSAFSKVTTGYASTIIECENTMAFKKSSLIVCLDFKGKYLHNIWLNSSPYQADNDLYKQFLLTFSSKYPFLLSDWNNATIVDISSPQEIDRYFLLDKE